jgi:hypothetical protein
MDIHEELTSPNNGHGPHSQTPPSPVTTRKGKGRILVPHEPSTLALTAELDQSPPVVSITSRTCMLLNRSFVVGMASNPALFSSGGTCSSLSHSEHQTECTSSRSLDSGSDAQVLKDSDSLDAVMKVSSSPTFKPINERTTLSDTSPSIHALPLTPWHDVVVSSATTSPALCQCVLPPTLSSQLLPCIDDLIRDSRDELHETGSIWKPPADSVAQTVLIEHTAPCFGPCGDVLFIPSGAYVNALNVHTGSSCNAGSILSTDVGLSAVIQASGSLSWLQHTIAMHEEDLICSVFRWRPTTPHCGCFSWAIQTGLRRASSRSIRGPTPPVGRRQLENTTLATGSQA